MKNFLEKILTAKEEPLEPIQKISENLFLLSGKALLEETKEILNLSFEDKTIEDLKTVNGFMLSLFQGIPKEGDKVVYQGWEFYIKKTRGRKVILVEVRKLKND